jgi:DNA mismatch repair ATPase MutS
MKAWLMFDDCDFDPEHEERPQDTDLIRDLDLSTVWAAAAHGDDVVHASVRTAMLEPLIDPARIQYRSEVLADCLAHPDVIRSLYDIACEAINQERQTFRANFFSHSSEAVLNRAATMMGVFVVSLKRLRAFAEQHARCFRSRALIRLCDAVQAELDDGYFTEVEGELQTLRFRDGMLASARLGRHNQGVDYALRLPRKENQSHLRSWQPPVKRPRYSRSMPHDDIGARQDLTGLRDRILRLAADSLGQAVEHIHAFFSALRAETAFYVGCVHMHDHLVGRGLPVCRAEPDPPGSRTLTAEGLYNPSLALRTSAPVQGNDVHGDGKPLIIVTGANQGGKTMFLGSLGIAHLMMQAGLPVAARAFAGAAVVAVFTHYAREEDASMAIGKFDEELRRMSLITRHIRPGSLLLCNESFAATNEREAAEIAGDVLRALSDVGIAIAFVTHSYELAYRFHDEHTDSTLFLRAQPESQGERRYQLREAAPLPTSYGEQLYRSTFAEGATANEAGPGALS